MSAVALTLGQITAEIREVNIALGWRKAEGPDGNTWGDYIALLHTEVSEALEAYRDHRLADATGEFGEGECSCAMSEASLNNCSVHGPDARIKPEGVGSEFADVLIRLVDMADVWQIGTLDLSLTLAEIADLDEVVSYDLRSFGDWMSWLHMWVHATWQHRPLARLTLRALVTTARHFGIDLEAEYRRKIAYNRTREFQHGGRTLAGEK